MSQEVRALRPQETEVQVQGDVLPEAVVLGHGPGGAELPRMPLSVTDGQRYDLVALGEGVGQSGGRVQTAR